MNNILSQRCIYAITCECDLMGIQLLGDAAELRIQVKSYQIRMGTLLNDNKFSKETGHRNTGHENKGRT